MRFPSKRQFVVGSLLVGLLLGSSACTTTRFYQREKLSDQAMRFDANTRLVYIRNKTEAAREGAFGGFGGAAAGGCGCQ